jgi:hypothetical protein
MTGACLFCGTLVLSLCGCNDSTSSNGEAAGGTTSQSGDADTATGQSGDADSAGTSGNDSNGGDTTSGSAGIEGDPCAALDLTFASTDCSDPSTCLPITCECTGTTASFGACSDDRCVDGLDCEILCALTPIQIDNCVRRVYGPIVECTSAAVCDDGPCVEALGVMLCGDRLACIVDEQCGYHCADGHCASDPLTACTNASECTWSCTDGQCTSGAAGSPCTDSAQCEANFLRRWSVLDRRCRRRLFRRFELPHRPVRERHLHGRSSWRTMRARRRLHHPVLRRRRVLQRSSRIPVHRSVRLRGSLRRNRPRVPLIRPPASPVA